jgi:O-antigen/teichoic acid export membrane protein
MAVARNVIANTVGTAVLAVATATTTILSFRLAGAEQFGLIGFYFTLHGIVAILDTGIGPGIVREVAYARSGEHESGLRAILFTFQGIYAGITGLTTIALIAASSFIATTWLTARTISTGEMQTALILSALIIAAQRQRTVYSVFLEGLERQVIVNILQSGAAVLRAVVVLAALIAVAPTAIVFLTAFLIVCIAELAVTAWFAWEGAAEKGGKARFSLPMLRRLWRFLLTSSLAVAAGAGLMSIDKLVVSAMLPLDVVGRYMFVSQICLLVLKLIAPNVTAIFPRLAASVRRADIGEAKRVYFAAAQTVSSIVATFGLGAVFFGYDALLILTGNGAVAHDYHRMFVLLAFAFGFNGFALIPNALRLSEGRPGTALWSNLVAGVFYLPAAILLTPIYGVLAPAALWLAVNVFVFAALVARAHRDALAGYGWPWLWNCLILQFAATGAVYACVKALLPPASSPLLVAVAAVVAAGLGLVASVGVSADLRHSVISFIRRSFFSTSPVSLAR